MKFANSVESDYIKALVRKHGKVPSALVALRNNKPKLYLKFTSFASVPNSENLYKKVKSKALATVDAGYNYD